MKKILITGINGLVGSSIAQALINDHQIIGTIRANSDFQLINNIKNKITLVQSDIREIVHHTKEQDLDIIIHTAAIVSFDPKNKAKMDDININGTIKALKLAQLKGIPIIHFSSTAAIGRTPGRTFVDENNKWVNSSLNSAYAISKHKSEEKVWNFIKNKNGKAIILNPSIILGKGKNGESSYKIFTYIKKGFPFYPVGNTGFVTTRDINRFIQKILEDKVLWNERYILNSFNASFFDLFKEIASQYNVKTPFIPLTKNISYILMKLDFIKSKLLQKDRTFTKSSYHSGSSVIQYSNAKIKLYLKETDTISSIKQYL